MNAQTASRSSTPKLVPDPSFGVGLPAHIVAGRALCITDPLKTKSTLLGAVQANYLAKLSRVAAFWNSGYDLTSTPKARLTSSRLSRRATSLRRSGRYRGRRSPAVSTERGNTSTGTSYIAATALSPGRADGYTATTRDERFVTVRESRCGCSPSLARRGGGDSAPGMHPVRPVESRCSIASSFRGPIVAGFRMNSRVVRSSASVSPVPSP